jgi:acetylornithine deacetylase
VSFTTDIPALVPAWGEPFLFGPGSIHVAHTTAEKISKRELLAAVETYAQMTRMLLSRATGAGSTLSPPKERHA